MVVKPSRFACHPSTVCYARFGQVVKAVSCQLFCRAPSFIAVRILPKKAENNTAHLSRKNPEEITGPSSRTEEASINTEVLYSFMIWLSE